MNKIVVSRFAEPWEKQLDRIAIDGRESNTMKRMPTADEQVIDDVPEPFQRVILLSALRYDRILKGLPTFY